MSSLPAQACPCSVSVVSLLPKVALSPEKPSCWSEHICALSQLSQRPVPSQIKWFNFTTFEPSRWLSLALFSPMITHTHTHTPPLFLLEGMVTNPCRAANSGTYLASLEDARDKGLEIFEKCKSCLSPLKPATALTDLPAVFKNGYVKHLAPRVKLRLPFSRGGWAEPFWGNTACVSVSLRLLQT